MNKEERKEIARRKQKIVSTIAEMVLEAKTLLLDAKQIGVDAGIEVSFDALYQELGVDQNWYASDPSLC